MDKRVIRRAAALAVVAFLISATAVFADTVPADGDFTLPGNQATIDLGAMGPGQTVTRSVNFSLVCGGTSHPAVNATLTIQPQTISKPLDGTISSTSTTIGPVPAGWPTSPNGCPSPGQPTLAANGPVTITLKTPTTAGIDYQYTIIYARLGASGLTGTTAINFMVDVVVNAPPSLSLPGPMTVEATSAAGATVLYVVGASDVEDDPDPTPTCTPASGTTFSLGQTTVACSVTDSASLTTTGSFVVTVKDSAGPSLTLPADITAEATSASGAAVTWTASATDLVDPSPSFGCSPVSGSTFALGTTTVHCAGTDFTGNTTNDTFDVTVVDSTAPDLTLPADIAAEATSGSGAVVTYSAAATDAVDGAPVVSCAPASGSTFPFGTTTVHCSATDATGNSASDSFDVVVGDSTDPSLTLPATIVAEATSGSGAVVSYTVGVSDTVDPGPTVTCAPASGATFPLGTTSVTCNASDAAGNTSAGSFDVVVRDTTDPVLGGVPGDMSVTTANPSGASVSWSAPTAHDSVSGNLAVTCSPASGSTFPVGTSTVNCSASDGAGNSASASFRVTVTLDRPADDVYSVQWSEPVTDGALTANQGRSVPLKLRLFVNGVERTSGNAALTVTPCGGGSPVVTPLDFSGGRWSVKLDTASLAAGCNTVTASLDGHAAGSFVLDLRGTDPAPTSGPGGSPGDKPPKDKPKK